MVKTDIWMHIHPKLADKQYLISEMKMGRKRYEIAQEIGCDVKTLRKALQYHQINYPRWIAVKASSSE